MKKKRKSISYKEMMCHKENALLAYFEKEEKEEEKDEEGNEKKD